MSTSNLPRYFLPIFIFSIMLVCIYFLSQMTTKVKSNFRITKVSEYSLIPETRQSSLLSDGQMPKELCQLSLMESDGWFCEVDNDWKLRKQIHRMQDKRNRNIQTIDNFFERNWEPTIHCSLDQRVGRIGDGGKWVCDIHKLKINNTQPLIYSFGSQGDFSFEKAVKALVPNAEIHTFDVEVYPCPPGVCTFHQATIGDGKQYRTKSLNMIIDELGHRQRTIDIFKVDIEGSEYAMFGEFFNHPSNSTADNYTQEIPYIRQILMEIHLSHDQGHKSVLAASELFELFRFNNYAIFHKEANLFCPKTCHEYAFLRLNPKFFISSE